MKPLRLLYAIGPGNVVHSYRCWKDGTSVASETVVTYSSQFFDFCREHHHSGYAISSFDQAEKFDDGSIIVENRPKHLAGAGLRYHLSQVLHGISLIATAIAWRADAVIVDTGTTHWAILGVLKLARIKVIGCLHNTIWPAGFKPTGRGKRLILASEGWFWRNVASAEMSLSPECERQVRELAAPYRGIAVQYRGQFKRGDFASVPPPPRGRLPFRIMFAGRLEQSKGVFDIVEMARMLEDELPGRVHFDICGSGPARDDLEQAIEKAGLRGVIETHGRLNRADLIRVYAASHAVIVPTRSDFVEGFAQVCAEAVLCGRPVITSPVVPAVDVLQAAMVLARTDDPRSYADRIRALVEDPAAYQRLCDACPALQEQIYDPKTSLTAALESVFAALEAGSRTATASHA
jgi:glycosyltransferase involved in cell wall biosynthesis